MKIKVFYDYIEGALAPIWYVIRFTKGELDWNKDMAYVPVASPFDRMSPDEFPSDSMGVTVTLGDLTLSEDKPGKFGISLDSLRKRATEIGKDYWEAEFLVLQVSDLEELLHMNLFREVV
ncbi:hypothetical protein [Brevibacillus choshinensis]|uniref:hypothetical protein n=1 Tax=Brevibacillus choshinensis TaxID=54911 RepID=UPI002E222DCA|nr:hypothetical protein [Brevibacillus choshinensis]